MMISVSIRFRQGAKESIVKLSKEQAARNREQILEVASRLFRQRGIDAVSVAEVMDAAGFTHGGFYNHFADKGALAVEAVLATFEETVLGMFLWIRDNTRAKVANLRLAMERVVEVGFVKEI